MAVVIFDDAFPANGALVRPHRATLTGAGTTLDVQSNQMLAHLPANGGPYTSMARDELIIPTCRNGMIEAKYTLPAAGTPTGEWDIGLRDQADNASTHVYGLIGHGSPWLGGIYDTGDTVVVGGIGLPTQTAAHQYGAKFLAWGHLLGFRTWDITASQTEGALGSSSFWGQGATYLTPGIPFIFFGDGNTLLDYKADDIKVTHWDDAAYPVADRGTLANVTGAATSVVTITNPTLVVVGNYLFMRIAVDNSGTNGARPAITSVVDSRSNTWTVVIGGLADPGVANAGSAVYFCYARITTAYQAADTITVTWTTGSPPAKAIVVEEWANVHPTNPIAQSLLTPTGATATVSIGPLTPTVADQVVYCVLSIEGPNADTLTSDQDLVDGTGWFQLTALGSTDATAANNQKVYGVAKPVAIPSSSTPSAHTWDPTLGTIRDWAGLMVVINSKAKPVGRSSSLNQAVKRASSW